MSGTRLPQGFPVPVAPLVDPRTGQITGPWLNFLQSLWLRTGGSSGMDAGTPPATSADLSSTLDVLGAFGEPPDVPQPDPLAVLLHDPAETPAPDDLATLMHEPAERAVADDLPLLMHDAPDVLVPDDLAMLLHEPVQAADDPLLPLVLAD